MEVACQSQLAHTTILSYVSRCSKLRHTKKSCDSQVAMQTFVAFLLNPRVHKTHLGQFENAKFRTQGTPTCKTDNVLHLMEAHGGTCRHCIRSRPPGLANVRTSERQNYRRVVFQSPYLGVGISKPF